MRRLRPFILMLVCLGSTLGCASSVTPTDGQIVDAEPDRPDVRDGGRFSCADGGCGPDQVCRVVWPDQGGSIESCIDVPPVCLADRNCGCLERPICAGTAGGNCHMRPGEPSLVFCTCDVCDGTFGR